MSAPVVPLAERLPDLLPLAARVHPVVFDLNAANMELVAGHLLVGILVAVLGIVVHASATMLLVTLRRPIIRLAERTIWFRLMTALSVVSVVMMIAHCIEIWFWSLAYLYTGTSADPADVFYFAFVNYTTLGYGDILPSPSSRLLAPMTAGAGILMFGWSTALMAQVATRYRAGVDARH